MVNEQLKTPRLRLAHVRADQFDKCVRSRRGSKSVINLPNIWREDSPEYQTPPFSNPLISITTLHFMRLSQLRQKMPLATCVALLQLIVLPLTSVVHRCDASFNFCDAGAGDSDRAVCCQVAKQDRHHGGRQESPRLPDAKQCPICHAVWTPGILVAEVDQPGFTEAVTLLRQWPVRVPSLGRPYRVPNRGPPHC